MKNTTQIALITGYGFVFVVLPLAVWYSKAKPVEKNCDWYFVSAYR